MDKKIGLVAFFDILGYQNFLEKNEPEIAAEIIAEFIENLKSFQSETYLTIMAPMRDSVKPIIEKIVPIVISDSILLTLETDKGNKREYADTQATFLLYCTRFFKELFLYGLPPRGAIEYGEYVLIENQIFAGRPIVRAFQSATNLDLAACQVSDSLGDLPQSLRNVAYTNYNTPLRTGEEKELVLLMPFNLRDDEKDELTLNKIPDVKQFIMRSFCAHYKMINREVQKKISNTEFFLRYCGTRYSEK